MNSLYREQALTSVEYIQISGSSKDSPIGKYPVWTAWAIMLGVSSDPLIAANLPQIMPRFLRLFW